MKPLRPLKPIATLTLMAALGAAGCANYVSYRADGFKHMEAGDTAAAVESFGQSVEARPTDFQAHYWLGVNLLKEGDAISAQAPLEQALALRPNDPEWRPRIADALADSYYQQGPGQVEKLYTFLDNMVVTYGFQTVDFTRKARFLGQLGDGDGQKLALDKAAYFAPEGDVAPYLALADFYQGFNNVPAEIQALKYAYHTDPGSELVKNRLRGLGIIPGPTVSDAPPKAPSLD